MHKTDSDIPQKRIYQDLIGYFGGVSATAKALKVAQSTVSGWQNGNHGMSGAIAIKAEAITGCKYRACDLIGARKWRRTSAGAPA